MPCRGLRGMGASPPRKTGVHGESLSQSLGDFPVSPISPVLAQLGARTVGLQRSDPIRLLPASRSTTRSSQELSEKGMKTWGRGKAARWEAPCGKAAEGFVVPRSGLTPPPPKNPNFYTNPCRKSCCSRGGEKHVHPFIDGTRDGLPSRAGTAQAPEMEGDAGRPRGKPFFRGERGKAPAPLPKPREQSKRRRCAAKPSVSRRGGVLSPLSPQRSK